MFIYYSRACNVDCNERTPYQAQKNKEPCDSVDPTSTDPKNEVLILALKQLQNCSDEDVVHVKSWILTYKQLAAEQKMYARKAVQAVLFEALFGQLNSDSVRINVLPSHCTHMTNSTSHNVPVYYEPDAAGPCELVCQSMTIMTNSVDMSNANAVPTKLPKYTYIV